MKVLRGGGASKFDSISLLAKKLSAEELLIIDIDGEGDYKIFKVSEKGKQSILLPSGMQWI